LRCRIKKIDISDYKVNDEEAVYLTSKLLYCLPLAIEQAGAYMLVHKVTIKEYTVMFQNHPVFMLDDKSAKSTNYDKTVYATYCISFSKIQSEAAKQLFNICAYFSHDDIPLLLLREGILETSIWQLLKHKHHKLMKPLRESLFNIIITLHLDINNYFSKPDKKAASPH